jgi:hypothetical protein
MQVYFAITVITEQQRNRGTEAALLTMKLYTIYIDQQGPQFSNSCQLQPIERHVRHAVTY